MKKIAFVHTGSFFHLATVKDPAVRARPVTPVYWPDYSGDFSEFDAVYLAARNHPGVVAAKHGQVLDFLGQAGNKVFI
ncbi:hypothetical protein QP265_25475, partial [Escherichia coli]|nr:hypothetical protein [Escherichia coli]